MAVSNGMGIWAGTPATRTLITDILPGSSVVAVEKYTT
jgi:hypothetical protein